MAFDRISENGFSVATANNNQLDINGNGYYSSIDSLRNYLILPVTSLGLIDDSDLSAFDAEGESAFWNALNTKIADGIYADKALETGFSISSTGIANPTNAYDKNKATYASHSISLYAENTNPGIPTLANDYWYARALKFGLPSIPKDINIDSVYLGVSMISYNPFHVDVSFAGGTAWYPITSLFRRFGYSKQTDKILSGIKYKENNSSLDENEIDDIPDFYASNGDGNDYYFYRNSTPSGDEYLGIHGHTLSGAFKLTGCTREVYNTYSYGSLLFRRQIRHLAWEYTIDVVDLLRINELAIIIKLSDQNIKSKIFSPLSGRIFNNTWGTRKTAANLMQNPVDLIEHCKRLQNWSETGETGTEWGKAYASSAKIATSTDEGSFDSSTLSTMTAQYPAFQLETESEGYTADLVKRLCRTFDLCTYIGPDGAECIDTMELTDPAETIAFTDLAGDVGDVEEPRVENVFCEPVVNYQYNAGSGDYDKTLRVFNIQAYAAGGAWTGSSSGFTNQSDAETVLDLCAALWERFRSVEKCPSDFTDQRMIVTEQNAVDYLVRKLSKMNRARLRGVPVHYDKGGSYHFAQHIQLNLPHQTRGGDVECMIERVEKNKNDNRVTVDLVLLEAIPE